MDKLRASCTYPGGLGGTSVLIVAMIALVLQPSARTAQTSMYIIDDVGAGSFPDAIDDDGIVVGQGRDRAWLFDGVLVNLETRAAPLIGLRSYATGIAGRYITGIYRRADSPLNRGFVFHPDLGFRDVGSFGGASMSPYDVSATGWVTGVALLPSGEHRGFLADPSGGLRDLGSGTRAHAVTSDGQVVGMLRGSPGTAHAFRYDGTTVRDLGTLGGWAMATSVAGRYVVGLSTPRMSDAPQDLAFLHDGTMMIAIGTLTGRFSAAWDVSDDPTLRIVGDAQIATGDVHAFLYADGTMIDLNTRIPAASGWILESARSINRRGQIVGYGRFKGDFHGFRLTPQPAP